MKPYHERFCEFGGERSPYHEYEEEMQRAWSSLRVKRCVKCGFRKPILPPLGSSYGIRIGADLS